MKVMAWIQTDKVGSKCEFEVDFNDEELEGMPEREREEYFNEVVQEQIWNHAEWGWKATED